MKKIKIMLARLFILFGFGITNVSAFNEIYNQQNINTNESNYDENDYHFESNDHLSYQVYLMGSGAIVS